MCLLNYLDGSSNDRVRGLLNLQNEVLASMVRAFCAIISLSREGSG